MQTIAPVSRSRGLIRSMLFTFGGILLTLPAFYVWPTLQFTPSPTSNRLTDYAMAITIAVPFFIGIVLLWHAARWLLFSLWPARMAIEADDEALYFRLGPFGQLQLDWLRLETMYAFECDDPDEADPDMLGLEPEEEMQSYLPKMRHPLVEGDVKWLFARFTTTDQAALAAAMSPHLRRIRGDDDATDDN
jgi:hypothetical protein